MLREPRKIEKTAQPRRSDPKKGRFRFVKLEERITPKNHHRKV
jgi:hypothetical protein